MLQNARAMAPRKKKIESIYFGWPASAGVG
jgi:hypothetical protein